DEYCRTLRCHRKAAIRALGRKAAGAATRWAARAVRPEPGAHARAPGADQRSALRQAAGGRPAHADSRARTAWAADRPGAPAAAPRAQSRAHRSLAPTESDAAGSATVSSRPGDERLEATDPGADME